MELRLLKTDLVTSIIIFRQWEEKTNTIQQSTEYIIQNTQRIDRLWGLNHRCNIVADVTLCSVPDEDTYLCTVPGALREYWGV